MIVLCYGTFFDQIKFRGITLNLKEINCHFFVGLGEICTRACFKFFIGILWGHCWLFLFMMFLSGSGYPVDNEPGLTYEVKVESADDSLRKYLLEVSDAHAREDHKPASIGVLKHRAKSDLPKLYDALRARGYYDGQIRLRIEEKTSASVIFAVESGPLYRLGQCRVDNLDTNSHYQSPSLQELGLILGEPAEASRVLTAENRLLTDVQVAGHALAKLSERDVLVNHDTRTMEVALRIEPGPTALLGDVNFIGAPGVKTHFLQTLIPWKFNTPYQPKLLDDLRQTLVETDLFTTIRVQPGDRLNSRGQIPIHTELTERFHRTFKTSLGHNVTKGPAISLGWWHRNTFSAGERLSFEGTFSGIGYSFDAKYRQPSFYRPDQALVIDGRTAQEDTDAYTTVTSSVSVGLERQLRKNMTFTLGPALRFSKVEDLDTKNTDNVGLLSFPIKFDWDFSDNHLNATQGGHFFLLGVPYVEIFNTDLYFGKLLGKYSHYLELLDQHRLILAGRVALGATPGVNRDALPADERFHAGGGGSIRGYGYQMAGPLNIDGKPIGGASLLELSAEARIGITQDLSGVLFVDSGGAFEQMFPNSGDFLVGVGVGIRYTTPIGPLRFDIGVPTKKREQFDDAFQLYLSIGQAF